MHTFDFTPLYRSSVGFDRLARLLNEATHTESQKSYPPYNVEVVDEGKYRITMAVAGFTKDEIDIEIEKDSLKVTGQKARENQEHNYLHQGIATRSFSRTFRLADHVKVQGAGMQNGMLNIELELEVPEEMKPRKIAINDPAEARLIESRAA
jgi:molecular chaperone IbpA